MTNLSLLSRGSGLVVKNFHEKLEVHFEPEDYLNWKAGEDLYDISKSYNEKKTAQGYWNLSPPKTYSTKRGALVLYSEDLALPAWQLTGGRQVRHGHKYRRKKVEIELHTLRDLTGAILAYGRKQKGQSALRWQPYFRFLCEQDRHSQRQIRPGYSAKRYLTCLSQAWDPGTVNKLQRAGCIRDSVLPRHNPPNVVDHSQRVQDLSAIPPRYRLLPVFASLHHSSCPEHTSGQYIPVQEKRKNKHLERGWEGNSRHRKYDMPQLSRVSVQKLDLNLISQPKKEPTWDVNEACAGVSEDRWMEFHHNEGKPGKVKQEHSEKQHKTSGSFENDNTYASELQSCKSHLTFYGGPFPERRQPHKVKQGHRKHQHGRKDQPWGTHSEGDLFPPLTSTLGPEHGTVKDAKTQEAQDILKLPPILKESPQPKFVCKCQFGTREMPKELLILPLLIRFPENKHARGDDKDSGVAEPPQDGHKSDIMNSENPEPSLHGPFSNEVPQEEFRNLQMNFDWNSSTYPDVDLATQPVAPELLLPVNRQKRARHRNIKRHSKTSNDSTTRTIQTEIIRGALPEELREYCKSSSVGSLIMGPDGEILCLSFLGSAQDTGIPVQIDFMPDEGCLLLDSEGSDEEERPDSQQHNLYRDGELPSAPHTTSSFLQDQPDKKGCTQQTDPSMSSEVRGERSGFMVQKKQSVTPEDRTETSGCMVPKKQYVTPEDRTETLISMPQLESTELSRTLGTTSNSGEILSSTNKELVNHKQQESTNTEETRHRIVSLRDTTKSMVPKLENKKQHTQGPFPGHGTSPQKNQALAPRNQLPETLTKQEPQWKKKKQEEDRDATIGGKKSQTGAKLGLQITPQEAKPGGSYQAQANTTAQSLEINNHQFEGTGSNSPAAGLASDKLVPKKSTRVQKSQAEKQPMTEEKEDEEEKQSIIEEEREEEEIQPMIEEEEEELQQMTEEEISLLKELSKPVTSQTTKTGMSKGRSIRELKKRRIATKLEPASNPPNKINDKSHRKEVFVVGKPKEKKSAEKENFNTKKKSIRISSEKTTQETVEEVNKEHGNIEVNCLATVEETEQRSMLNPSDGSPTSSCSLCEKPHTEEEFELEPESEQIPNEDLRTPEDGPNKDEPGPISENYVNSGSSQLYPGPRQLTRSSRDKMLAELAEKRRMEVEKKRREREEQKKQELDRMEKMKQELEEEQRRRAEEISLRRKQLQELQQQQELEAIKRSQQEQEAQERALQQQEEHRRKLQELQRRMQEEEQERAAEEQRKKERERQLMEERERLLEMSEAERLEYLKRKQEEEEQARIAAEKRQRKAEEQARLALEEAKIQAELLNRQRVLESHLQFHRELLVESYGLEHTQDISRPWVFSYFQLLKIIGLHPTIEEK
uniref:Uncharacterized protein KIAA2012 homolog isoform X2 n=1 Tax=Geotrypetes seraphini TaxID=260995 RepID=A0A6P8RIW7_GEOSA|nr:uncharacterized protein KIAA2012 homolog isoform X2 [Geotrypetes seraphini]